MELKFLADRPDAIPIIATWYFQQWGHVDPDSKVEKIAFQMQRFLNRSSMPLSILAVDSDEILGVAELKYHEMEIYPDKEHWIGGVFVPLQHRGKGVASIIINRVIEVASSLGVNTLHLQTEQLDGGLYKQLGWEPCEKIFYQGLEVLVMERALSENDRLNEIT